MENLFNTLSEHVKMNLLIKSILIKVTAVKSFKKPENIINQGDTINTMYYIEKGIVRKSVERNNKNITTHFITAGNFFTCHESLQSESSNQLCKYNFDLITPGQLLHTDFKNIHFLFKTIPAIKRVFNKVMQDYYYIEEKRVIDLLSLSATELYQNFLHDYPEVSEHAKLGDVASYLGIEQESLSRIRKKIIIP
jgi:CRP/FNR family transcriptional regulator, anaerobic regulatory protein